MQFFLDAVFLENRNKKYDNYGKFIPFKKALIHEPNFI